MVQLIHEVQTSIVVVPDMAAVDLTALVEKELDLTHLGSDYRRWDYYRGLDGSEILGRGRKYEVLIWKPDLKPNETIPYEVVRGHFKDLGGFYGHAAAFTQWRRVCGLNGYHATILDALTCLDAGGDLYVPYSGFDDGLRWLGHRWLGSAWVDRDWVDRDWHAYWSFVGFREISS